MRRARFQKHTAMKSCYITSLLFLFVTMVHAQDLDEVRKAYPEAVEQETTAERLYAALDSMGDEPLVTGYKGAVRILLSKHAKGPKEKIGQFKEGREMLENALAAAPGNIEIRCLRLGIQENAPGIVNYNDKIEEDKRFVLEHYPQVSSQEVKDVVKNYVKQAGVFSAEEKELF